MDVKFSMKGIILKDFSDDGLSGKGERGYEKLIWGCWFIFVKVFKALSRAFAWFMYGFP